MGRPSLFPIDPDGFPASVLAQLVEEALLSIQRVPVYLGNVRDPKIAHSLHGVHGFTCREAIASAISASIFKKFFTIKFSTSLAFGSCGLASVYVPCILVNAPGACLSEDWH